MGQLKTSPSFRLKPGPDLYRQALRAQVPERTLEAIEKWVDLKDMSNVVILDTSSPLNLINVISWRGYRENGVGCIINLKRINDIRFVNKFLESANEYLRTGGLLVGCVETTQMRKQRLLNKYLWPFNILYYFFDFWVKRVWPKMPRLKQLYFLLTNGRNRVISETETYGRLYSCGFRLVDTVKAGGRLYFIAEKIDTPDYNTEPTYGPLIHLKRVGKNGKVIRVRKFRTMHPYSEYIQQYVIEKYGLQEGGKVRQDPRVNSLGRFMRKCWIDEVPMLYNVLNGDLKVVGVRPISKQYLSQYPKAFQEYRRRFKPGFFPPFYADMPKTIEEIVDSEKRYLEAYEKNPLWTDVGYLFKILYSIVVKRARSN
jgi:lipopolysaccharide/colanic/teichoic acid biosynthesis glycosyltransferase